MILDLLYLIPDDFSFTYQVKCILPCYIFFYFLIQSRALEIPVAVILF